MDPEKLFLILVGVVCALIAGSIALGFITELSAIIGFIFLFPSYLLAGVLLDDRKEPRNFKKDDRDKKQEAR